MLPSILCNSHSVLSLTALNDDCNRHSSDDGALKLAAVIERDEPMQEVYEVPLRSDNKMQSSMCRAVSFLTLASIHQIQSREDLLDLKQDMWFGSNDISQFAHDELSRHRNLGITSTDIYRDAVLLRSI
jgi:hypothetical protein